MKKLLILVLMALSFSAYPIAANAQDVYSDISDEFGVEGMELMLSEEEKSIIGQLSLNGDYDVGGALARLWRSFISKTVYELKNNLKSFTVLVCICLLASMGSTLSSGKTVSIFLEVIACASAADVVLGSVDSIVGQTVNAMYRLSDYSKAALPVVFTAAAAGGAMNSSAVKFAAVTFALDVLMSLSQKLIIPVIYAFLALSLSASMFSNPLLTGVQRLCKWTAGTLMSAMTIAFTSYISMIGAIGSAVDTSVVKTAKTIISGALPVVGGMISDASAMVLSAAGVVRTSTGIFGLITVCIICAGPFALISVKMMLLKAVSAVADSMEIKRLSSLFSSLGTTMALLLGLLGSCGIMLFISITAAMKAVVI